jgi:hypothetical protein
MKAIRMKFWIVQVLSLMILHVVTLDCVESKLQQQRRPRRPSSENYQLRGTTSSEHNSFNDDVEDRHQQHRELWGREFDFGSLLDEERQKYSSTKQKLIPSLDELAVNVDIINKNEDDNIINDNKPNPRIVGGQDSQLTSFAIHLRFDEEAAEWKFAGCGGTLISNCHVLTAAHCVTYPRERITQAVYVNAWRPFNDNTAPDGNITEPFHFSHILPELTMVHEGFVNDDNSNDIAILTLETCTADFETMDIADPTFLRSVPVGSGTVTQVAGFGQTFLGDPTMPDTLQSVEVEYINSTDCERDFYPGQIKPDMYCAGSPDGGKDSCLGDSGVSQPKQSDLLFCFFFSTPKC